MRAEIAAENELMARQMFEMGDYVGCFLLIHVLVEGALRNFLQCGDAGSFHTLISEYQQHLVSEG